MEEKPADEQQERPKQPLAKAIVKESKPAAGAKEKPLIWDCGSSLYDSFELKSFEKQLDSAIHSRSLSMPHFSNFRLNNILDPKPPPPSQPQPTSKKSSKLSRSIHRLLRSVFKPKQHNSSSSTTTTKDTSTFNFPAKEAAQNGFYVVYEKSGVLSTIPEVPELDSLSPEIKSFVKRSASDRFIFTPVGISCA